MTEEEFYSDEVHETTFLNRISSFLAIPYDTVRIVGIADIDSRRRNLESGTEI